MCLYYSVVFHSEHVCLDLDAHCIRGTTEKQWKAHGPLSHCVQTHTQTGIRTANLNSKCSLIFCLKVLTTLSSATERVHCMQSLVYRVVHSSRALSTFPSNWMFTVPSGYNLIIVNSYCRRCPPLHQDEIGLQSRLGIVR